MLPYRRLDEVNGAKFHSFRIHHRLRARNEALWEDLKARRTPFDDAALPELSASDLAALKPVFFCVCTFCRAARRRNGVPCPYLPGLTGVFDALPEHAAPGAAEDLALDYALRIDRSPDALAVVAGHCVSELMRRVPRAFPALRDLLAPRNAADRDIVEEMHAVATTWVCTMLKDPKAARRWDARKASRNRTPGTDGKRYLNWLLHEWLGMDAHGRIQLHAFVQSPCGRALLDLNLIRVEPRPRPLFHRDRPLTMGRLAEAVGPHGPGLTPVPPKSYRKPAGGLPDPGHVFKLIDYVLPAEQDSHPVKAIGLIPRTGDDAPERATFYVIDDELDAGNRLCRLRGIRRSSKPSTVYLPAAPSSRIAREGHEPDPHQAADDLDALLALQPSCDRENAVLTAFATRLYRLARAGERPLQAAIRDAVRATDAEVASRLGLRGRTRQLVDNYPTPLEIAYCALRVGTRCRFARVDSPFPTAHPLRPYFRRIKAFVDQPEALSSHAAVDRLRLGRNVSRHFDGRLKKLRDQQTLTTPNTTSRPAGRGDRARTFPGFTEVTAKSFLRAARRGHRALEVRVNARTSGVGRPAF